MNGRLQNELNIDAKTEAKIKTMPDYVNAWYLNMKASRKTAATKSDYVNKVHRFLTSINDDPRKVILSDINTESVTKYFLSLQTRYVNGEIASTSDSYQASVWCCLESFLGYLVKAGLIPTNYIENIDKPKNHDLDRINEHRILLTEKDFKRILKAVTNEPNDFLRSRDYALLLIFMNTGIRKSALMNIMLDDIDILNKKLVVIDKGNKRHEYILNENVIKAISEWIAVRGNDADKHLFISSKRNVMAPKTIEKVVKKYSTIAIGMPISPHKLRSGYCSILYKKTGDIEFVRRCVGHASSATTQRYIVTNGSEKQKAAEILSSLF